MNQCSIRGVNASWQPAIDGRDVERAREAIEAVARDLERLAPGDPSLYHGQAGIALFHGYRAYDGDERAVDLAGDALATAVAGRGEERVPWLGRGFAGTGFALAHLSDLIDPGAETLAELDRAIAWVLDRDPWPSDSDWELIAGLIGLGVVGLERADTALVERVLGHLAARAETGPDGATWLSPVRAESVVELPVPHYNLGLPYGVAGAVGFLTAARSAGVTGPANGLLEEAIRWLRAQDRSGEGLRFPSHIVEGRVRWGKNGWCYGDPITAVALVGAGLAAGEPSWLEHGVEVALHAARSILRAGPAQAGLSFCHGLAGHAHLFNRLAQATGSSELGEAARTSYRWLLDAREPGSGIGGFRFAGRSDDEFDHGLQLGAAGLAICLLAGISDVAPDWDRAFLTALPPHR